MFVANVCTAEAKNEKFMRFNMGEDAPDYDAGDEVGVVDDEDGVSSR
jgi:hypothetical protein